MSHYCLRYVVTPLFSYRLIKLTSFVSCESCITNLLIGVILTDLVTITVLIGCCGGITMPQSLSNGVWGEKTANEKENEQL